MAKREPFAFARTDSLPAPSRPGPGNGVGRTSPYDALIAELSAHPGEWYELACANDNQAYSRATTLRKTYGMEAHARGGTVYVRNSVDGDTPATDVPASTTPVAS